MSKHTWIIGRTTALALFAFVAGAQIGCDNSCYSDLTCPSLVLVGGSGGGGGAGGSAEPGCPEDPIDGLVPESCGIWVSASLGVDTNPGTQALPLRSITAAVGLALTGPRRIYACGEVYEESVTLPAGVSLFGGFTCAGQWAFVDKAALATIAPLKPEIALRLGPGQGASLIGDVEVIARDAKVPGDSSIAVFALPGSVAAILRARIVAGDGADGMDGEDGKNNGAAAKKGIDGVDGADACAMEPGIGGASVFLECEDGSSTGGQGGNGGEQFANDGAEGQVAPAPNPQGFGLGGSGEAFLPCTGGLSGAHGANGDEGKGASTKGRLTIQGVLGASGEDGASGVPGQGGGGGGASRGKASCGAAPHGGPGGGSGGSGGCGGRGGKGGQAGGSAIGLASLSDGIRLDDVVLHVGNGGNGGNGGTSQPGGQGGLPGLGGAGLGGNEPIESACPGGAGGYGGHGGNGGGGHGGHVACFAATKGLYPSRNALWCEWGLAGAGGHGGDPGWAAGVGQPGQYDETLTLDP